MMAGSWRRSVASRFGMAESCRIADRWHIRLATNFYERGSICAAFEKEGTF
jgi:hypothetical protein